MDSVSVEVVLCTRNDVCTNGFEYVVCVCDMHASVCTCVYLCACA